MVVLYFVLDITSGVPEEASMLIVEHHLSVHLLLLMHANV